MSNMEKLVTSTHAGVKEERNVVGKFCNMSSMKHCVKMMCCKARSICIHGYFPIYDSFVKFHGKRT